MTNEQIYKRALEDIIRYYDAALPTIKPMDTQLVIAKKALAEAADNSPWIRITPETMPEECDINDYRLKYEVASQYDSLYANRIDGDWCYIDDDGEWHSIGTLEKWTHYRKILLPPLPGSETE